MSTNYRYFNWNPFGSNNELNKHEYISTLSLWYANGDDYSKLTCGKQFSAWSSSNKVFYRSFGEPPDHGQVECVHVVSDRMRDFLAEYARKEVLFLPVELIGKGVGPRISEYNLVIPLNNVDCVYIEGSAHVSRPGWHEGYLFYGAPKLVRSKIPPRRRMFRLKYASQFTILREDLVEAIKMEQFSNNDFTEMHVS